jgi:hypothetical protein
MHNHAYKAAQLTKKKLTHGKTKNAPYKERILKPRYNNNNYYYSQNGSSTNLQAGHKKPGVFSNTLRATPFST